MSDPVPAAFESAWRRSSSIPGWLKEGQARMLYDDVRALPRGGTVLEIGSHQGRSTVVLAEAARDRDARVIAVDPFVDGKLFGGQSTRTSFEQNLTAAGVDDIVTLVPEYSTRARPTWSERLDLLYIDGKHDYWTFTDDLQWKAFLPEGGRILVHDAFSSIGVTLGILVRVLFARDVRYLNRSDSMARFEKGRPTLTDRLRVVRELPWWLRNVAIKVLLRLRLRAVARAIGHDSPYDPY